MGMTPLHRYQVSVRLHHIGVHAAIVDAPNPHDAAKHALGKVEPLASVDPAEERGYGEVIFRAKGPVRGTIHVSEGDIPDADIGVALEGI